LDPWTAVAESIFNVLFQINLNWGYSYSHCDLEPANLMLCELPRGSDGVEFTARVMSFGGDCTRMRESAYSPTWLKANPAHARGVILAEGLTDESAQILLRGLRQPMAIDSYDYADAYATATILLRITQKISDTDAKTATRLYQEFAI
jgi:hypothetical protein